MANTDKYSNKSITELLRNIAAAHTLKGENRFRIIAYEKAADAIEHLSREIEDIWKEGKIQKVPGIGPGIGQALSEFFETGTSKHFQEILKGIPPSVFTLMKVPGIGPKKAFRLVAQFGLTDPETVVYDLMNVARANKISTLEGFGQKSQDDIIEALQVYQQKDRREERMPLPFALSLSKEISRYLQELPEVKRTDSLGSLRRRVSTIGDIDISVVAEEKDFQKIVDYFLQYPGKRSVEGAGPAKASIIAAGNIRIDLRVQDAKSYGSMLQYFTGSKAHNIKLREYALKKGYSLSEYGLKKVKGDNPIVKEFADEESLYNFLGLPYIPPEIREGTNEIEIALKNKLPKLIELTDIKGDFHIHSSYDIQTSHDLGLNTYEELVENAKKMNYEYIGFADHNPKNTGLSSEEIITIMKERKSHIDKVLSTASLPYFIGLEVDITPNGELALPEKAIEYVDFLIVSVHSSFKMSTEEMTKRVMKALSYPKVKIFGHPTARLLGKRDGIDVDWNKIFEYVTEHNIAMEINASPSRLDLPDVLAREAHEAGVKFMIDTDSHAVEHMDFMQYGIFVAKRAWITKREVINTKPYKELKQWMEQ
ncbi:MAG TPA: DNA polymerase/3'-5' exonuclease PolX [Candidatus Woesebacteria bacterium]|nr:DNA polymerase/3'-5' exonuclease PolX [Candidatus Woesebacteria bacterium]